MRLQVLFDSRAVSEELHTGWGISCLIDGRILFDTGEKGPDLLHNMERLGIDLTQLEEVIISHDHWDHTGGLWDILKHRPGLAVHICSGFSRDTKDKIEDHKGRLVEHKDCARIRDNIYVTGEIPAQYKGKYLAEQALILSTPDGLVVLTGCAHPGIVPILKRVQKQLPRDHIDTVMGGFHLIGQDDRKIRQIVTEFREFGIQTAGPTHCSGTDAQKIFRQEYGEAYLDIEVGRIFVWREE